MTKEKWKEIEEQETSKWWDRISHLEKFATFENYKEVKNSFMKYFEEMDKATEVFEMENNTHGKTKD